MGDHIAKFCGIKKEESNGKPSLVDIMQEGVDGPLTDKHFLNMDALPQQTKDKLDAFVADTKDRIYSELHIPKEQYISRRADDEEDAMTKKRRWENGDSSEHVDESVISRPKKKKKEKVASSSSSMDVDDEPNSLSTQPFSLQSWDDFGLNDFMHKGTDTIALWELWNKLRKKHPDRGIKIPLVKTLAPLRLYERASDFFTYYDGDYQRAAVTGLPDVFTVILEDVNLIVTPPDALRLLMIARCPDCDKWMILLIWHMLNTSALQHCLRPSSGPSLLKKRELLYLPELAVFRETLMVKGNGEVSMNETYTARNRRHRKTH